MPDREITAVRCVDGRVAAVAGAFGTRTRAAATIDIQNGAHTYHVVVAGRPRPVVVVRTETGRHLRTVEDLDAPDPLCALPAIEEG